MFVFQFDVAAKAGFWVTVITMGLSALVAILIFIAQNLFRSGDFNVQCRRHAYIDRRDVRLYLTFENVDAKDRVYSGFDLYGKKDGVESLVAHLDGLPLSNDPDSRFISRRGSTYSIAIPRNARRSASLTYTISPLLDLSAYRDFSIVVVDDSSKVRAAYFPSFDSTDLQELHFHRKKGEKR